MDILVLRLSLLDSNTHLCIHFHLLISFPTYIWTIFPQVSAKLSVLHFLSLPVMATADCLVSFTPVINSWSVSGHVRWRVTSNSHAFAFTPGINKHLIISSLPILWSLCKWGRQSWWTCQQTRRVQSQWERGKTWWMLLLFVPLTGFPWTLREAVQCCLFYIICWIYFFLSCFIHVFLRTWSCCMDCICI